MNRVGRALDHLDAPLLMAAAPQRRLRAMIAWDRLTCVHLVLSAPFSPARSSSARSTPSMPSCSSAARRVADPDFSIDRRRCPRTRRGSRRTPHGDPRRRPPRRHRVRDLAAYYLASTRVGVLARRPLVCGVPYGIAVYVVMNRVVIRCRRHPRRRSRSGVHQRTAHPHLRRGSARCMVRSRAAAVGLRRSQRSAPP